jgi:hypothetical protein
MGSGHREVTNEYLDWQITVTPLDGQVGDRPVRYRFSATRRGDRLIVSDLTAPCKHWLNAMVEAQKYVRTVIQDPLTPPAD